LEIHTMTNTAYATHAANQQAIADAWMAENGHQLEAEVAVGDDAGRSVANPRPASDKALHTINLSGNDIVTERQMLTATESAFKTSQEPSGSLAGVDPESLGFYVVTRKQSEMATRERSTYGIEFTRNVKGQTRGGKSGKTRETKAEKAARLANRFKR
jgi:hypothetical protein